MTIPVKYVDAARVAQFLNENVFSTNRPGLSNSRIVVTNPNNNELVLFGTDNDYKMAQKIVAKIDVKPISVNFKVNHSTPKEMAYLICQSIFPNAIAIFKKVNKGPQPVSIVGTVCINLKLNFDVIKESSLKKYKGSTVVCIFCTVVDTSL